MAVPRNTILHKGQVKIPHKDRVKLLPMHVGVRNPVLPLKLKPSPIAPAFSLHDLRSLATLQTQTPTANRADRDSQSCFALRESPLFGLIPG